MTIRFTAGTKVRFLRKTAIVGVVASARGNDCLINIEGQIGLFAAHASRLERIPCALCKGIPNRREGIACYECGGPSECDS